MRPGDHARANEKKRQLANAKRLLAQAAAATRAATDEHQRAARAVERANAAKQANIAREAQLTMLVQRLRREAKESKEAGS